MNKGQFRVPKRTRKDYTLAFKLQVVDEVEKGELNKDQAQRKYGIQGNATILVWLRKAWKTRLELEIYHVKESNT